MRSNRLALAGWTAFAVSGGFFLAAALRSGDELSAIGSVVWLIGIGFFLAGYRQL